MQGYTRVSHFAAIFGSRIATRYFRANSVVQLMTNNRHYDFQRNMHPKHTSETSKPTTPEPEGILFRNQRTTSSLESNDLCDISEFELAKNSDSASS